MTMIKTNSLEGLIPVELTTEIINKVQEGSAVMKLAKPVEMTTRVKEFPVRFTTAGTYWVNESEKIQVSEATWGKVELVAKKIGTIVPVTKEALNEGIINVIEEIKEQIAEDIAVKFDNAALLGVGSPFTVGSSIFEKAGKYQVTGNLSDDVSDTMALVEEAGLDVNAFISTRSMKNQLRKAKDEAGFYIFEDKRQGEPAQIHGVPTVFSKNLKKEKASLIAGDFNQVYVGILNGLNIEILTEATVDGINLAQQDMIGIKATMDLGFLVVNDKAFAALTPTPSSSKAAKSK